MEIVVQICGKIKSKLTIPIDTNQDDVIELAKKDEKISAELKEKKIIKEIYVKNRLLNIVAK